MIVIPYTVDTPYEALAMKTADLWRITCPTVPVLTAEYDSYGDWLRNTLGMVVAFAGAVMDEESPKFGAAMLLGADVFPGPGAEEAVLQLLHMNEDFACEVRPGQPRYQAVQSGVTVFNLLTPFGEAALNGWELGCATLLAEWDRLTDADAKRCPDQVVLGDVFASLERYGAKWRKLPEWTNARHGNNPDGAFQHPPASRDYRKIIDGNG